jgi:hypothetical protein
MLREVRGGQPDEAGEPLGDRVAVARVPDRGLEVARERQPAVLAVRVAGRMPRSGIESWPRPVNQDALADAAARPPPSRKRTAPVFASWISQNASPPTPVMCG